MTLGMIIKEYRERNRLSQRQFALMCDVSNGYISMLEEGRNPKTNEPMEIAATRTPVFKASSALKDAIKK